MREHFLAECRDLTYEGKGVCDYNGRPVFVEGILPKDVGEIEISYERNHQLYGEVCSLSKLSPNRIEPRCKIHHACGGCSFQCLNYETQKEFKRKKVEEQFRKVGKIEISARPTIGMDENPYSYRNKIQVHFGKDQKGKIFSGFYKEGTHVLLPVKECFIENKKARSILSKVNDILNRFKAEPFYEHEEFGDFRSALIRTSFYRSEVMLVLVTAQFNFRNKKEIFEAIKKECPELSTLVHNINGKHTNVILGEQSKVIFGRGYIEDELCRLIYKISPKSFYQVNPPMTEILYKTAIDFAKLTPNDVVLDAYSGIGTIGLTCAKDVKKVIAVEVVPDAVRDAIENAKRNKIDNFSAYLDDAPKFMVKLVKENKDVDVLFVDPPRKGCEERFLSAAKKLSPRTIVYVSCNPSTLARDAAYLSDKYELKVVQPVDLFPMTFHVETIALLTRK